MDTVTLSKQNRLFWLGRYTSRAYGSIRYMMQQLDARIDGKAVPYEDFCRGMGIPCPYENEEAVCRRCRFNAAATASLRSCVDAMLGNGMTLRETITSPTLAYLQMAQSAMDLAARSEAPAVELQWVLDDIMAFRGSFDDTVEAENVRNITKTGGLVERLSLMLRLGLQPQFVDRELRKLLNRLYKTGLAPQPDALALIERQALEERSAEPQALLAAVEGLFVL